MIDCPWFRWSRRADADGMAWRLYNCQDGHQGFGGKDVLSPKGITGFRCELTEHRNPPEAKRPYGEVSDQRELNSFGGWRWHLGIEVLEPQF